MSNNSILTEAQGLVHGDRGQDYGHPLDDFSRTAAMWSVIVGVPLTPEQVGLCMCAVKISRQVNRPKRDNLVDLAGYAETVSMVIDEQARRAIADELDNDLLTTTFGPLEDVGIIKIKPAPPPARDETGRRREYEPSVCIISGDEAAQT